MAEPIQRSSRDLPRVWREQQAQALRLYGPDVTAGGNWGVSGGGYPATDKDYALVIINYWMAALHAALNGPAGSRVSSLCNDLAKRADSGEAFTVLNKSAFCGFAGRSDVDWLEKSGLALEQMFKAAEGAVVGPKGTRRIVGLGNAQLWNGVKTLSIQLSSLDFMVTGREEWQAFKEGALEGVENVGAAVTTVVEKGAEGIAATLIAFFKGLGLVGVAFAVGAVLVFKAKLL